MNKKILNGLFGLLLLLKVTDGEANFSTIGNLSPSAQSKVSSQVSGKINQVSVEIGDIVTKGQTLAELDIALTQSDYNLKVAQLEAAKIDLADAEINFQRMQNLWNKPSGETPSISLKRFEDAKLRLEHSHAQLKQTEEALNRAKIIVEQASIQAPFDGVITKKFVDPGESVTAVPVTEIVEVQSLTPLYLEFAVPQGLLNEIAIGTPLTFIVEGEGKDKRESKISLIYPCIDEATRSVKCRAVIDNRDLKLRPGSLVKVEINTP